MIRIQKTLYLVLLFATTAVHASGLPNDAAATVDGRIISKAALELAIQEAAKRGVQVTPPLRDAYLDGLIRVDLLANRAKELGLGNQLETAAKLELHVAALTIRAAKAGLASKNAVSGMTITSENTLRRNQTAAAKSLHTWSVREIHLATESAANALLKRLQAGDPFFSLGLSEGIDCTTHTGVLSPQRRLTDELPNSLQVLASQPEAPKTLTAALPGPWGWMVVEAQRDGVSTRESNLQLTDTELAQRKWALFVTSVAQDAAAGRVSVQTAPLTWRSARVLLAQRIARGARDTPVLRNAIDKEVALVNAIVNKAKSDGLLDETALQLQITAGEARLLADALQAFWIEKNPISTRELRTAYERQVNSLERRGGGTVYSVAQIVAATEQEALLILERLKKGAEFGVTAREVSIDQPTKNLGGQLGWVSPLDIQPELGGAILAIESGELASMPIQTAQGWHIVRVNGKKYNNPSQFEESAEAIRESLMANRWITYLENLRKRATITKQ